MNQQCKVCGEPAAGFHFGAFTCEGCKSFFGRSYNNLNQISECKNNGECIINKKNRTACKACRLKKCLLVGMSKSGSRYGRRSNWFKIHCLLQEQQAKQNNVQQQTMLVPSSGANTRRTSPPPIPHNHLGLNLLAAGQPYPHGLGMHPLPRTKEEIMLLSLDEYKHANSPSVSSPESHNSDSSVEVSDARRLPIFSQFLHPQLFPPPSLMYPHPYTQPLFGLLQTVNNNNRMMRNHNPGAEALNKRIVLDAILQSQRTPTPPEATRRLEDESSNRSSSPQEPLPIDLSMKSSERGSSPASSISDNTERIAGSDADEEDCDSDGELRVNVIRPTPLDLTTRT